MGGKARKKKKLKNTLNTTFSRISTSKPTQILARSVRHLSSSQSGANSLDGSVDLSYATSALVRHVQIVRDRASSHFEHVVRCRLVDEYLAESRNECSRRTRLEAAVDVVGHQEQHAQLFQCHELKQYIRSFKLYKIPSQNPEVLPANPVHLRYPFGAIPTMFQDRFRPFPYWKHNELLIYFGKTMGG